MTSAQHIIELERAFWQALVDRQPARAAALVDDAAVSASGYGIHHFGPAAYAAMATDPPARLTAFRFFDEQVLFPLPDVAVLTYGAEQTIEADGRRTTMKVFDSTTWVRRAGGWRAVAHTETPAQAV